jgi:gliding motility-associated-like protein
MFKTSAMKGILALLFLLLLLCSTSRSQNLVPNPSFEEFEGNCPDSISFNELKNWYAAYDSPDYYTSCNTWEGCFAPANIAGYQIPKDGNGYTGFALFVGNGSIGKEYPQVKLAKKLTTGAHYKLSFYINLANSSGYAIDQIGAWLHSDSLVGMLSYFTNGVIPQICSPIGVIQSDTLEWVHIQGCFQAKGDEQYLTIGNFRKNSETNFDSLAATSGWVTTGAYYFVDLVELYQVPYCSQAGIINNIITPNGDELNDMVQFTDEESDICSLSIYNRWGNLVYSSTGKNLLWNGLNQQGNTLFAGVYYYVLECGNERKNGTITLFN